MMGPTTRSIQAATVGIGASALSTGIGVSALSTLQAQQSRRFFSASLFGLSAQPVLGILSLNCAHPVSHRLQPVSSSSFLGTRLVGSANKSDSLQQQGKRFATEATAEPMAEKKYQAAAPQDEVLPGLRRTVWDQQDLTPRFTKLEENATTDVVVVGGGIAGLSIAYNLVRMGITTLVLEARVVGAGMTGSTTAHLMPWNDDYYHVIEQHFGQQKTFLVGDSHREAINWVERTVLEEGIECKFQRLNAYLFASDESESTLKKLREEYDASKRAGFDDIEWVEYDGQDPSLGKIKSAIRWPSAADFHPLLYLNGLAEAVHRRGGRIHELSRVVSSPNKENTVTTADGKTVRAKAVVYATDSPIHNNLAVHARQSAKRSYVVGLKVPKGAVKTCDWWDTSSPYHYVRIEHKDDYDVLVVGGGDHPVGIAPKDYPDSWEHLEKWARQRWTMAGEVLYKWTGMLFEPIDFLHLHGRNPIDPNDGNLYIATGDSGEGMTGGTIAGLVISSLIAGKPNRWVDIYSPSRIPPPSLTTAQMEAHDAQMTAEGYGARVPYVGADSIQIEDLGKLHGAVVQHGLNKVAVYRDEKGIVHRYSALCTHMGCVVKWNPKESTFDCPCHGSLFDRMGRCINGPGSTGLEPLS